VLKKWDDVSLNEVERAAEGGDLTAQHYLGYCHFAGRRGLSDPAQALAWYERAGKAGYMPSLNNIGVMYEFAKGVPQDSSRARAYYLRAAEGGMPHAMANLGLMYLEARGVPKDRAEAGRWLQKAIEQGDIRAELYLGVLREEEGESDAAYKLYQHAADQGEADAMFKLYQSYWNGVGVKVNRETARQWLKKGAEAGSAKAQFQMGYELESPPDEDNSPQAAADYAGAVKWYERAAGQNHSMSQYRLAQFYFNGKGVEKNEARGLELIRGAADQDDSGAMLELAALYCEGIGEPRNEQDQSVRIWQRYIVMKLDEGAWYASDRNRSVYRRVVFRLLTGLGTQRDWVEAARWYSRAAVAGVEGFSLDQTNARVPLRLALDDFYYSPWGDQGRNYFDPPDVMQYNEGFAPVLSLYCDAASHKPAAASAIAELYVVGRNTPVSPRQAWIWFTIAAQNGSTDARVKAAALESRLSADELKQARQLLAELVRDLNAVGASDRTPPPRR
jgi:uncharacterized protein